jgi:hypothetical protein
LIDPSNDYVSFFSAFILSVSAHQKTYKPKIKCGLSIVLLSGLKHPQCDEADDDLGRQDTCTWLFITGQDFDFIPIAGFYIIFISCLQYAVWLLASSLNRCFLVQQVVTFYSSVLLTWNGRSVCACVIMIHKVFVIIFGSGIKCCLF